MAIQLPVVSLVLFGATALLVASGVVGYRHQDVPGAVPFAAFMGFAALWAGTYGLQLVFTTVATQLFWANIQFPAGMLTSITFGVFVLHYTGQDHQLNRRRLAALYAPVAPSLLVWIPQFTDLAWRNVTLVTVNSFVIINFSYGPLFYVLVGYSYLVVLGGLALLFVTTLQTRALYRKQTALVTVAAFVPLVGGVVAYLLDLTVIDYTPVGLAVFGVSVAVALSRYRLLDVFPVPRDRIINQIDTGIIVTDGDDRIVDINPVATRIVGRDIVVSQRLGALGSDAADEMVAMDTDTTAEIAVGEDDPDYFQCTKSTVESDGAFGETYLYMLTDVTERRRRQEALKAKNDRLDSFAEVLSHDLRNPLSVASGSAELARNQPEDRHFDRLANAHDRMSEIIENMLTLARSGDAVADMAAVDVGESARDAWSLVDTADATLTVDDTRTIEADPQRLQQLFENLFRNAVEHGGEAVTVRVGTTESGFYVGDDGPGIPAEERASVFDSGVSGEMDGTGVGLAIVQTIVDGHGWTISVTDSWAGGARFDIVT